jgi:cell shape-determining protein MreC
VDAKE